MTKKFLKYFSIIFILMIILVIYIILNILPYSPITPNRVDVRNSKEFEKGYLPSNFGLNYDTITFRTFDNLKIKGYVINAENPIATLILLHGIGDCKEHYYAFCKHLVDIHCNSIIIDNRAHGESEGGFCTFGYYEKQDISTLIDVAESRNLTKPLGIFGNSLGGAIALQSLGTDNRISFGIIESTFNRLENVVNEYFEDISGFKSEYIVHSVLKKSGEIANFKPFEVNPVEYCKNINCPILMAHGDNDQKIPISFGRENFENIKSTSKQFIVVPNAGHFDLQKIGGENYLNQVFEFIKQSSKQNSKQN